MESYAQVEWQTLKWVAWYNTDRIHSAIDYKTPNEAEDIFYANLSANEEAA